MTTQDRRLRGGRISQPFLAKVFVCRGGRAVPVDPVERGQQALPHADVHHADQGDEVHLPGVQDADDERVRHARPGGRPAEARRAGQTQRYFSYTLETVYRRYRIL